MFPWHQYIMGLLYIVAGVFHFWKPNLYLKIMPPYLPTHGTLVQLSGIAEMVFALMLLNAETQTIAAWAIIAMLVVFLTVHVHMLQNEEASLKLPKWVLILRIPLQFGLMFWAYQYV